MVQISNDELEKKFLALKNKTSVEDWSNPDFLYVLVAKVEKDDIALAFKLIERAHNLRPDGPKIKKKMLTLCYALHEADSKALVISSNQFGNEDKSATSKSEVNSQTNLLSYFYMTPSWMRTSWFIMIVIPWLLFAFYQIVWSSPRYESRSQLVVKKADDIVSIDPSAALKSNFGMPESNNETKLVKAYILSNDMLEFLKNNTKIISHYSDSRFDFFSRLHDWSSREDIIDFYVEHVSVEIDEPSSVITISSQAFSSDFSQKLNKAITERAEWFINSIGHQIADEQLNFVRGEHEVAAKKLSLAKTKLLAFQARHNILDPTVEGVAYQQIAYNIEGSISSKKTELYALQEVMAENSPKVKSLKRSIDALEQQLIAENTRLSGDETKGYLTVSEKLAGFSEHKIELEITQQAFTSSLIALEKARVEAYRQLQHLVIIETSTLPQDNKYPRIIYNLSLLGVMLLMFYGVGRIILSMINEFD